jgi:hypothetical protein
MRGLAGLAGAAASFLVIGLAVIPAARAGVAAAGAATDGAQAATLYVDQWSPACSDQGSGTQGAPFCSIQHAADVADPGQTVDIEATANGQYTTPVTISRSGTAQQPITFTWPGTGLRPSINPGKVTGGPVLTIRNAQYVTFSRVWIDHVNSDDGVDVIGSSHITLDQFIDTHVTAGTAQPSTSVSIDGTSSDVTVSRVEFLNGPGSAVVAHQGSSGVTVTTNEIAVNGYPGILLDGSSGAAVTSNGVGVGCSGITVAPNAVTIVNGTSAAVENNLIEGGGTNNCPAGAGLSVDASSAGGTTADYNAFNIVGWSDYSWAGTSYQTAADFQASSVGQGAHDFDLTTRVAINAIPAEGSPLIDSADCAAPGELATDIAGQPRVDDPMVPNAGSGSCHADRGVSERQDNLLIIAEPSPVNFAGNAAGAVPFTFSVSISSPATSGWNEPVTYTIDFGDGSPPVPAAPGTTSHLFTTAGRYTYRITAADTGGSTLTNGFVVYALDTAPAQAALTAAPAGLAAKSITPDAADFRMSIGAAAWEVFNTSIDFGDGSSKAGPLPAADGSLAWSHTYLAPGTYTAKLTITDLLARTSTTAATITVGDEIQPVTPKVVFSHTIAAHAVVKLPLLSLATDWTRAALVNVIVTSPRTDGYVAVYPAGSPPTTLATVRFRAGQPAENSALAYTTSDAVDFANASSGPVNLAVVTYAVERITAPPNNVGETGASGATYVPVTPARVLPATTVAAAHHLAFPVAGRAGVPASASAVVLDVTSTGSSAAGRLITWAERAQSTTSLAGAYWLKGQAVTGLVTVPVNGRAVLDNDSKAAVSFTADVVGYYAYPAGTSGVFLPAFQRRLLQVQVAGKHWVKLGIAGKNGVPAASAGGAGTTAVAVNLTASGATGPGTITAYADGSGRPGTTSLAYTTIGPVATAAIVAVGADGAIDLYNGGLRPVTLAVDLAGSYYAYS